MSTNISFQKSHSNSFNTLDKKPISEDLNIFSDISPAEKFSTISHTKKDQTLTDISPAEQRKLENISLAKIVQTLARPVSLSETDDTQEIDQQDTKQKLKHGKSAEDFQEKINMEKIHRYKNINKKHPKNREVTSTQPQKKGIMSRISKKTMWYTSGGIISYIFGAGLFG